MSHGSAEGPGQALSRWWSSVRGQEHTADIAGLPCPRCSHASTRALGTAHSSKPWFSCPACHHVWTSAPRPVARIETALIEDPPGPLDVVIVDDDITLLRALQRALHDYGAVTAQCGEEALALLGRQRSKLLISDFMMPDMTGDELIARARARQPNLKSILLTGHAAVLESETWWPDQRHLLKPCGIDDLRRAVADLIGPASHHQFA